jgi:hypothetical protein
MTRQTGIATAFVALHIAASSAQGSMTSQKHWDPSGAAKGMAHDAGASQSRDESIAHRLPLKRDMIYCPLATFPPWEPR